VTLSPNVQTVLSECQSTDQSLFVLIGQSPSLR